MRRLGVALGLAAIAALVAGAMLTAHLDPFLARPILDGLAPPALYRWVDPPPALASTNQPPQSAAFTLSPSQGNYDPKQGSGAGVFGTPDFQVSLALSAHAVGPTPGATSLHLTIGPIAPASDVVLPPGTQIAGNVVHIEASYQPAGGDVSALRRDCLLTLSYPIVVQGGYANVLLVSPDGHRWTAAKSTDHPGQQFVLGTIRSLGYFAVGQSSGTGSPIGAPTATTANAFPRWVLPTLVIVTVAAAVAVVIVRRRGDDGRRPPPPPDRDARTFDPRKD